MEIIADFDDRYVNEIPRLAHSENFGDIYFENFITELVSPDGIINRMKFSLLHGNIKVNIGQKQSKN